MKLAVVGDTHGNMSWVVNGVIPHAVKHGVEKIVQVGDFGFVWPDRDYPRNLDKLNRKLDQAGLDLHFLPGNHEDHTKLRALAVPRTTADGHHMMKPRIFYTGRYAAWTWAGRRLAAVGGAVSIDRTSRQEYERRTGTTTWWPDERLSDIELAAARDLGKVDVLFTHDAPTSFPAVGLKPDLESTAYRQAMTDVGRALRPKLWFHGHYHVRKTYKFEHDDGVCEVHALDCDGSSRPNAIALVDLAEVPT